jgi:excisionase family DNA binding protein
MTKDDKSYLEKWLNINAVCNYSSLSASTIRRAVYVGSLKASRITGKMLFKVSEVDRWLNG